VRTSTTSSRGVKATLVMLLFALVVMAAPASASRAAKGKKACDVLKRTEIEGVLGQTVGKPQPGSSDLCYWQIGDPAATAEEMGMTLLVDRSRKAKAGFAKGHKALRPEVLVDIDGLGKDAYFAVGTLSVLKNNTTGLYLSGVFDQAQAEQLARMAIKRV
jgi:hypothetical protein